MASESSVMKFSETEPAWFCASAIFNSSAFASSMNLCASATVGAAVPPVQLTTTALTAAKRARDKRFMKMTSEVVLRLS